MKIILLIAMLICSFSEALRQLTGIPLAHIVLTLVQFFGFGIRWDYLNGIFGTGMGGNAEFSTNGLFDSEFILRT